MHRRTFLKSVSLAAGSSLAGSRALGAASAGSGTGPFTLKFGPHLGHFDAHAGEDILAQIRFAHSQGFRAWEDNRLLTREPALQQAMGDLFISLGMTMGVFVAYSDLKNPTMTAHRLSATERKRDKGAVWAMVEKAMHDSVAAAKRVGARWVTVTPGAADPNILPEYQTENVVEMLHRCAAILEPARLVAVLEPLNYLNHPGCFLQRISQAHQICRMVGSPSVKILDDLYHQQITEGNLITNMTDAWDEIAYIQVGDVPGRREPTTGEINYAHLFQWLADRGYDGVIGMEHRLSGEGRSAEEALIRAYHAVNPRPRRNGAG